MNCVSLLLSGVDIDWYNTTKPKTTANNMIIKSIVENDCGCDFKSF